MLNITAKLAMIPAILLNILLLTAIPYDTETNSSGVISAVILDIIIISKTV